MEGLVASKVTGGGGAFTGRTLSGWKKHQGVFCSLGNVHT